MIAITAESIAGLKAVENYRLGSCGYRRMERCLECTSCPEPGGGGSPLAG
ncbi:hypothetical protein ARTHRO9AX_20059 [Arthrobacter sp. 9AX]|nr:hypothetical protein ARTHRO9AX_20059 [Arthrobacter sp. 9AX]